MRPAAFSLALLGICLSTSANAQDTLEIGVLQDTDLSVVQRMLYPKDDRTEIGVHLAVMPFDAYVWSPNAQLSFDKHFSNTGGLSVLVGGGYGFTTATYRLLESPTFGVAPYAYRYLGSALIGATWSPVYAKLNWNGARVMHFDLYGAARAGATVEQSVLPDGGLAFGPTLSPAIGARIWLSDRTTFRFEVRDDLVVERRQLTQTWNFKQNLDVQFGLTFFGPVPEARQ